ncbi:MAG: aldehyde dehydrogenase family protein [Hyphomicrobiales bacterium]|nr:aldehyde dehydrogenase family protein [Hyphomicrobiales bacterium]
MNEKTSKLALPSEPRTFGFFVDGEYIEAGNRVVLERASPAHDVCVTRIPCCTREDLDKAVEAARTAFDNRRWSGLSGGERASVLLKAAAGIRERIDEIAYFETLENGKPISQARGEVEGGIGMFEYAAGAARALHGDSFNNLGDRMFGLVTREPIGVVGLITPWNFPFYILCERVPFILAAGCTIVAKPSEETSASGLILAEILKEAGLPAGVYNVVPGTGNEIGQAITEHAGIDMVSFTGSTAVGRSVVHAAAGNFKKLGLELGGKNPQIVFADADLKDAADGVAFGVAFNGGQCCVSGSVLVVERSVADEFEALLADKLSKIVVGDPLDPATQVGAITTEAQNTKILNYIDAGKKEGAKLVCGGSALDFGAGRFVAPTLFSEVTKKMSIAREEIFGPVLGVLPFDGMEEAVRIANDTEYGLAASIWTKNIDKATQVSRRVQAGRVWVNCTITGGPELPIGGFKQSGWGRETSIYGIEEYTQIKSVHIELGKRNHWIG